MSFAAAQSARKIAVPRKVFRPLEDELNLAGKEMYGKRHPPVPMARR